MIVADLIGLVKEVQIAYKNEVMPPKNLDELERYYWCPILNIRPRVYDRKPTICAVIDHEISPEQRYKFKMDYQKRIMKNK